MHALFSCGAGASKSRRMGGLFPLLFFTLVACEVTAFQGHNLVLLSQGFSSATPRLCSHPVPNGMFASSFNLMRGSRDCPVFSMQRHFRQESCNGLLTMKAVSYDSEQSVEESFEDFGTLDFSWVESPSGKVPFDCKYTTCGKCSASYVINPADFGPDGKKVQCSVCNNKWFQSTSRLADVPAGSNFRAFPSSNWQKQEQANSQGGEKKFRHDRKGSYTLFVGNLPFRISEGELQALFEKHGEVVSVSVIHDQETGRPRGFGFVDYNDEQSANDAVNNLNGLSLDGRDISVSLSEDKFAGNRNRRGGGRGGGGGRPRDPEDRGSSSPKQGGKWSVTRRDS